MLGNIFKHFGAFVRLLAVEKISDFFFREKIEVGSSSATISSSIEIPVSNAL